MAEERRAYRCAYCGEKCLSNWTEAEARAEYERDFGRPWKADEVEELCDDCHRLFSRGNRP